MIEVVTMVLHDEHVYAWHAHHWALLVRADRHSSNEGSLMVRHNTYRVRYAPRKWLTVIGILLPDGRVYGVGDGCYYTHWRPLPPSDRRCV